MPGLIDDVDPDGLLEYSVVFTDRSLNHMSKAFQQVMNDISATLQRTYSADAVIVVPGGGTYAMEAVARQLATGKRCLVMRNGWFSYRWSQIFDAGSIPSRCTVLKARPIDENRQPAFAPAPIEEAVALTSNERPEVVFATHVETSAGIILPDAYIRALSAAAHEVGALLVLDCIASGAIWVDMKACGVDVLISAPQKGWSASPSSGFVMLSELGVQHVETSSSTSYAIDLRKWLEIMKAYEAGGHAYHATMPTDALRGFRDVMDETATYGFDKVESEQRELGTRVRALLAGKGIKGVAAEGFEAPGVIVSYTDDPEIQNGKKFAAAGIQIAAGVPLQCDEPADFRTFRIGLFGLDKLHNIDRTVANLREALECLT